MSEPVDTSAQAVERHVITLEYCARAHYVNGHDATADELNKGATLLRALAAERAELQRAHSEAAAHYAARMGEMEALLATRNQQNAAAFGECDRLREAYQELLFAVGNKYTGETRHQTALRYIRAAEASGAAAMGAREGE